MAPEDQNQEQDIVTQKADVATTTSLSSSSSSNDVDFGKTVRSLSAGQKLFHRYTLGKILGRGGMGVVWLARDEKLERNVALKFVPEAVSQDVAALDDLKRETRRSLELTHPNIVRIYDLVDDSATAAISMEFVDGPTLSAMRVAKEKRVFETSELEEWVRQMCEALDYAHTKGKVVHRDLKPANLMVSSEGDLKVTDFGIAGSVSDSLTRITTKPRVSGTLPYMSPQQLMGEPASALDDVYSLGATLYDLLTSKPPFYSGEIMKQVMEKIPPPMSQRRNERSITGGAPISQKWEDVIAACLSKDVSKRPQSALEVAERLSLISKRSREGIARPVVPRSPATPWSSRAAYPTATPRTPIFGSPLKRQPWTRPAVSKIMAVPVQEKPSGEAERQALTIALPLAFDAKRNGEWANVVVALEKPLKALGSFEHPNRDAAEALLAQAKIELKKKEQSQVSQDSTKKVAELLARAQANKNKENGRVALAALDELLALQPDHAEAGRLRDEIAEYYMQFPQKGKSWTNTLKMKFAPVGDLLFCVWLTRIQDFEAFVGATGYDAEKKMYSLGKDQWKERGHTWRNPGYSQTPAHPVGGVSWEDAMAFCQWLTEKEKKDGLLVEGQSYRLPTDEEWTRAAGTARYPWGNEWPPPHGAGNYAGSETRGGEWPSDYGSIPGYQDDYERTSPVGSFNPNSYGLYDIGGNVWEWCMDWYRKEMNDSDLRRQYPRLGEDGGGWKYRVLRGASWADYSHDILANSFRGNVPPDVRLGHGGFRVIVELTPSQKTVAR